MGLRDVIIHQIFRNWSMARLTELEVDGCDGGAFYGIRDPQIDRYV
jgi:hypothetical protein